MHDKKAKGRCIILLELYHTASKLEATIDKLIKLHKHEQQRISTGQYRPEHGRENGNRSITRL